MLVVGAVAVCEAHEDDAKTNIEWMDEVSTGAQIDAPNLVKITETLSIGAEVGVEDLQQTWTDSLYVMAKVTWNGSLFDFTKKE